jgi:hypothetical protein
MQTRAWLIAGAIATSITFAQQKPEHHVTVLSVCEVVGGVNQYADTVVAVVGRMERSISLVDHSEVLSQDRCEHPIVTHGHKFPNKIQIRTDWEQGMPMPPGEQPKLDRQVLAAKLLSIRRATALGSHQEPQFSADGHPTTATVPNQWALVYGRIVRAPRLDEDCGAGGCGGDDVPLIVIAKSHEIHALRSDGRLLPEDK